MLYVWFSFRKIHGLAAGSMALLSLLHDLLVVFFVFVIFRIPIGDSFIAVALTILGYSINDTIVTIHQFCSLVLKSLGVAGDTDETLTLVESLTDLVDDIVDDRYLAHFRQDDNPPPFNRAEALALAARVVEEPVAHPRPAAFCRE